MASDVYMFWILIVYSFRKSKRCQINLFYIMYIVDIGIKMLFSAFSTKPRFKKLDEAPSLNKSTIDYLIIEKPFKCVLWQTVRTQMKCGISSGYTLFAKTKSIFKERKTNFI